MRQRTLRRGLALVSAIWMIGVALVLLASAPGPEVEEQARQRLEQGLSECQERFPPGTERYECTSALLRERSRDVALTWSLRLIVFFAVPIATAVVVSRRRARLERLREERRRREHLKRLAQGGHDASHRGAPGAHPAQPTHPHGRREGTSYADGPPSGRPADP